MKRTPEQIAAGRRRLRRQGMADAACVLVATRFRPEVTLADYGRLLGLTSDELTDAIARRRGIDPLPGAKPATAKAKRSGPPTSGAHACPELGCDAAYDDLRGLASHRLAAHSEPIPCPNGCGRLVNPRGVGPHVRHCTGPADAD